jgi:hypothetical protein
MSEDLHWELAFERELNMAENAREAGNEGMARVCSRRAAGIVINEYFRRQELSDPGLSTHERLRYIQELPEVSSKVHEIAVHLLTRVNLNHNLPIEVDLIQETRELCEELLKI